MKAAGKQARKTSGLRGGLRQRDRQTTELAHDSDVSGAVLWSSLLDLDNAPATPNSMEAPISND